LKCAKEIAHSNRSANLPALQKKVVVPMAIEETPLPCNSTHSAHLNKERQRKLPPAKKCAPYISYSKPLADLFNAIADGPRKQKQIIKPRSKPKQGRKNDTALMVLKKGRVPLQLWRKDNGLTSNHGYVKKTTNVLFSDTRYEQLFDTHPFFHKILYACVPRQMTTNHLWHCVVWSKKY
jgi:hypothetical protein